MAAAAVKKIYCQIISMIEAVHADSSPSFATTPTHPDRARASPPRTAEKTQSNN
jgi:hypothetical protein